MIPDCIYIDMEPDFFDFHIEMYAKYGINANDEETGIQALHKKLYPVSVTVCFRLLEKHSITITEENIDNYKDFFRMYHACLLACAIVFVAHGILLRHVEFDKLLFAIELRNGLIREEYAKLLAPRNSRKIREYLCEKWGIGMRQLERILYGK